MSFGGSGSKSKSKIEIPDFLKPLYESAAGYGGQAFDFLSGLINPNRTSVAGFAPQEQIAQVLGTQRALDPNSAFRTAADVYRSTAEGTPLSAFLPQVSLDALTSIAGGGMTDAGARGHLADVVGGKYLYGGEGFDAALDAAMKRILPEVRTQFGRSGAGGGTGTLAAEAFGDRAAEQFAMQYGQERGRQDSAAGLLEQLGLADTSNQMGAAQYLAALGGDERQRQLMAAEALPGIENLDLNLLSAIGGDIRGLEQMRLDKPMQDALTFLNAIFGVNAFGQPVGQKSKSEATQLGGGIVPVGRDSNG